MDAATYCIKVCGGKCCTLHTNWGESVRCPKQAEDGSCTVYNQRYAEPCASQKLVIVGQWVSKVKKDIEGFKVVFPFYCGHVKDIAASGGLPKEVAEQCCYIHPELLNMEESCATK
jgi:hypothetical protein